MSPEPKNQQQVTVPLTDGVSFGADFDCSYMDDDVTSDETHNSRGEPTSETLVTGCYMFFFLLEQVSDIGTFIYYVTLVLVHGTIIIHTATKWHRYVCYTSNEIHCTGTADWLRYISSLLVNWPDVKQYGVLCRLEWKLCKSPEKYAHVVPEWHSRRARVAYLKFMEGISEACPQAILQLCLLLPDLYGDLTWTDYLRIMCTAGAARTNYEKWRRIVDYTAIICFNAVTFVLGLVGC